MKDQRRVLLVEDYPGLQEEYSEIITDSGYSVDTVSNLQTALERIGNNTYHVAVVDIQLDVKDEHNRDGLAVIERLSSFHEGTEVVILSGQRTLEVAIEAYERFGIAQYLEKRKAKTPADIYSAVDTAYARCHIKEYGAYRSLTGVLSGENDATIWEHRCLTTLNPSGGVKGLLSFLSELCTPYTPLLKKKGSSPPMTVDNDKRCIYGDFWSKGIGKAVLIMGYAEGFEPKALGAGKPFLSSCEKANIFGSVFGLPESRRDDFVELLLPT